MCNSNDIDKLVYQSNIRKKTLAFVTATSYRHGLDLNEERHAQQTGMRSGQDVPLFAGGQSAREKSGKRIGDKQKMDKFFEYEEQRLVRVTPSLNRLISPHVKKAFVDCLFYCKDKYITKNGNIAKLFMTGEPVMNHRCAKIMLRMLYMLPSDLPCRDIVMENMITFAMLSKEVSNIKDLEWNYAWRLLYLIGKLQVSASLESSALLHSLAMLNKEEWKEGNTLGYYFGNVNLRVWCQRILSQEEQREALLSETGNTPRKTIDDIMEERRQISLADIKRRREIALQLAVGETDIEQQLEDPGLAGGTSEDDPAKELQSQAKDYQGEVKIHWNNEMKLELLRVWIEKTENPMIRSDKPAGKGVYMRQMKPLLELGTGINWEGQMFTLRSIVKSADTLAQFLQGVSGKGLSGQKRKAPGKGGLVHIIDEWLKDKADKSVDFIRSSCEEILAYARERYF